MKLNMDSFEEIINDFLTENEVHMLLTMPKGTQDVTVQDNTALGAVVHFFFILKAIAPICKAMREQMGIEPDSEDWAKVVDTMLAMVRREILPGHEGEVTHDSHMGADA